MEVQLSAFNVLLAHRSQLPARGAVRLALGLGLSSRRNFLQETPLLLLTRSGYHTVVSIFLYWRPTDLTEPCHKHQLLEQQQWTIQIKSRQAEQDALSP